MTADFTPTPRPGSENSTSRSEPASRRGRPGSGEAGSASPVVSADCPNVLAKGTEFSGTIEVSDSIRLEGKFEGQVTTGGTLHVVPDADVEARVQAAFVVIGGKFKGDVECEQRVDLLPQCRATGKLHTAALTIEEGALFDGDISMSKR